MTKRDISPGMQVLSYVAQLSATGEKVSKTIVSEDLEIEYEQVEGLVEQLKDMHCIRVEYQIDSGVSYGYLFLTGEGKKLLKKSRLPPYKFDLD